MSSTVNQAGNSSKEETSKSEEESGSLSNSQKITSFFPLLKPEGRAKISGLKNVDIKQKEILQKLKNKDTLQSKTKAENVKTEIGKPHQIVVKEKRANITVMSALKTPLSQVLRRSFESSHETRKEKPEKAKTDQDLSTDNTKKIESYDKNVTSSMTKQTSRAKKSFPDTESNNTALTRSQRNVHSSLSKPATPSLRSTGNLKKSSDPSPTINTRRRVTVSELGDLPQSKTSSKGSAVSQPPVTTSPTPLEDASHSSSGNKMKKNQKNRKRHFRGATYNLFLSKKSKRKNLRQKSAADESKDDDGSVDDSSYFDSEDGNSLMSEDLYSASEKSLADEEHNPDSCNSPLLANAQKNDSDADRKDTKEPMEMETVSAKHNDIPVSDETSGNEVKKEEEEIEVEADSVKEEEQSSSSHPVPESPTRIAENDETTETKDLEPSSEASQTDELQKVNLLTNSAIAEECVSSALDETKDFPEVFEKEEILHQEDVTEPAETDLNEMDCDNEMVTNSVQNSGDENDMENYLAENAEAENSESSSTIATCVKSRQRIKRRFTDDIVDTDVGILSLSSSAAPAKRVPPPKLDPPKDIIQMFQPVTQSEAKKGPASKIECIYNSHQEPIKSCTCDSETMEANLGENDDGVFCQAVDSIDDKLVGCSNLVITPWLVRSSVKIPFTIMCEMHLWRMKHHHSCPYCGLFCSQGPFMQCSNVHGKKKVVHLYHEGCQGKEEAPFCLHCGNTKGLKKVQLEMHMTSPPAFFMNQLPSLGSQAMEKARMSFASSEEILKKKLEVESSAISYKIEDTGKVLSSVGLTGKDKEELDKLLQQWNDEKPVPEEPVPEHFYNACLQGDTNKVLNMLAEGMDPNLKFPEHENDTPLHAAASGGHTTIVHLLIQAGSVNDTLNERIYTPLMLAVESNHKDVVFYLIKNGSVSDYKGENGMSSFHIAAKNGSFDILKILLSSRDIDINSQDDGGWTPIVWASEHDHYDIVKYLLTRGANPNIKDSEGNIGLHWSAFSGSVDISFLYLDYGCDINAVNERGDTPLHIAARQDALSCVTLFLSRGANVQLKNKSDQIPADCVLNKNGDTYLSLSLNMLLKRISTKYKHKVEKILHKDISRGKEQISIQCVNEVDDEPPPLDFLYVTENCETTPMNIDRTITSLQYCHCEDDCSTSDCTCASISYQCWYDKDGLLLPNFNLLDPPMLFECNRACSCWSFNCRNRVLQNGITCRLQLIRTKGKGWGVRTLKDIPKGTFICEYVGEMISDSAADKRADDSYLFDLDNRDGETYCLDARYYGNISRFINHLCEPNLYPVKVYVDHQDLNFPRIAFFSSRDIKQYEELGFDYCEKFWVIKYKYFTCDCGSPKCKYSKDTIHTTLANYYRRVREEQMEEQPTVQTLP